MLNGYYHHVRSIILEDTNLGLDQWIQANRERFPDFYRVLLNHYYDLGILRSLNVRLDAIIAHIRIWMLVGKIGRTIKIYGGWPR